MQAANGRLAESHPQIPRWLVLYQNEMGAVVLGGQVGAFISTTSVQIRVSIVSLFLGNQSEAYLLLSGGVLLEQTVYLAFSCNIGDVFNGFAGSRVGMDGDFSLRSMDMG